MKIKIYKFDNHRPARSVISASLVAEVEVKSVPKNQKKFAEEYGGDFIEIEVEECIR